MSADERRREAVRGLEGAIGGLLGEVRRLYAEMADSVNPGMLPGTYKVLSVIDRRGPVTASWLAENLSADKGQISRHISELEELGLVARSQDPDDGRIRVIAVTEEGVARLATARGPYESRLGDRLASWPVESIEQLVELLEALTSAAAPRD